MQVQFFKNFFPHHRTNLFEREITTFTKKAGDTLYPYWDRYKELLNIFPHRGFETWRLVSYFYRQVIEMVFNGDV